jgi:hypothetical protein
LKKAGGRRQRAEGREQGAGGGKVAVKSRNWIIYFFEFPKILNKYKILGKIT